MAQFQVLNVPTVQTIRGTKNIFNSELKSVSKQNQTVQIKFDLPFKEFLTTFNSIQVLQAAHTQEGGLKQVFQSELLGNGLFLEMHFGFIQRGFSCCVKPEPEGGFQTAFGSLHP